MTTDERLQTPLGSNEYRTETTDRTGAVSMIDAISSADDRLRLTLIVAENDLESAQIEIRDNDGDTYRLRARSLEDTDDHGRVIHIEESVGQDGSEWLNIGRYDREQIDDLAVTHRKQVRELHVREQHPQSHLQRREDSRKRQKVRNRKALQDGFNRAKLESWTRRQQVVGDV